MNDIIFVFKIMGSRNIKNRENLVFLLKYGRRLQCLVKFNKTKIKWKNYIR